MKAFRYLIVMILACNVGIAYSAMEVVRLKPEQYNIFLFNDGSGYIAVDGPVGNYLSGTFNCDVEGDGIYIPDSTELSDRVLANLLAAKVAGADIYLQVTDDGVAQVTDACRFEGSTYIGKD